MKTGINLLTKQKKYQNIEKIFNSLKFGVALMVVFFLLGYLAVFLLLLNQKKTTDSISVQNAAYLQTLTQNKEVEAQFVYFVSKEKQISTFLKNDVNFYPYYSLLNDSLSSSSPPATLQTFVINSDRTSEFAVGFNDFPSLLNFLKFCESDFFLQNFTSLHLTNFTTTLQQNTAVQAASPSANLNNFSLHFKGTFKQI